jgi:hypothetical protein
MYTEYYKRDKIKDGETDETCNTQGEAEVQTTVECTSLNFKGFIGKDG